jgi:photosystem II stability/assembly factor-like uncharacterized protein
MRPFSQNPRKSRFLAPNRPQNAAPTRRKIKDCPRRRAALGRFFARAHARQAGKTSTNTQGGYSFHMAVDPGSPGDGANDIIYFGAVGLAKSTNSGGSFSSLAVPHSDCHAWAFFPRPSPTASIVYNGNDGGLTRSTDGGATWTPLAGGGLQTGLLYNIDVKPDATASVTVGALQDNGLETTSGVASPNWSSPQGGDGWDVAYDGVTAGRVYGTSGFWPAPCTRVFVSNADGTDFPPTVPSARDITPWGMTSDQACGVFPIATDPSNAGVVYASGNQNLWQTRDAGASWRILSAFAGTGNVAVARANGNNVVIAVGTQVFVSTNALAATVGPPTGVTFTNITRHLPSRNVAKAVFDPNDPTIIYAVLGGFNGGPGQTGHVFRTTVGAAAWTDISPALDLPFNAIALDGTDTPTAIYVGTDLGVLRSVDGGVSWSVLDDIHFPRAPVTDLVLNQQAGVLRAATYGRGAFDFAKPVGPAIAVNLQNGLAFGTVCGGPMYLTLEIFNVGAQDLIVNSVQRLMGSSGFTVLSTPGTPVTIGPGDHVDFTAQYVPTTRAPETAIIRISSNDPAAHFVDLTATGIGGAGSLRTVMPGNGNIGNVCLGSFVEETLTINNNGPCPLSISNISSSSSDFTTPVVTAFPLIVGPGISIEVTIRFQPTTFGPKSATITVVSDDPSGPRAVVVSGVALAPKLTLFIVDAGNFGQVSLGSFADLPLTLSNSGSCTLSVTNITSSVPNAFLLPQMLSFPLTIGAGDALQVPIRFQSLGFGPVPATITVFSDDPSSPHTVAVLATGVA